mgnify:CR=1 FL=1|tara:strand:+ start:223 stop:612 length:390 start_codon:yes stop_codon:yes gene_type:complete
MSIFSNFGKKIIGDGIGKKSRNIVHRGLKVIAKDAGVIQDVSDKVSGVTGTLAAGAALIGAEPIAAGLLAVSGVSKGVSKGASLAGSASKASLGVTEGIDNLRSGNFKGAVKTGKGVVSNVKAIQKTRK